MQRNMSTRELAERMARAFEDAGVFIVERSLVDTGKIRRLIGVSGIDPLVSRVVLGGLEVYVIKEELAEARCRQTRCRDEPPERVRACIAECYYEEIRSIIETVRKSIIEAAESIEE